MSTSCREPVFASSLSQVKALFSFCFSRFPLNSTSSRFMPSELDLLLDLLVVVPFLRPRSSS